MEGRKEGRISGKEWHRIKETREEKVWGGVE